MDEKSMKNIILVHCERRVLLPPLEQSVYFILIVALSLAFPPETVFLSKLYPIQQSVCTSNHTPDYSTFKSSTVAVSIFQRIQIPRGSV